MAKTSENHMVLLKEFTTNHNFATNVLTFSKDGKLLISGGDDEAVRIWDTQTLSSAQVIRKDDWGQITALTLIYSDDSSDTSPVLCIGSGRGCISLLPMESLNSSHFISSRSLCITPFDFNDSVELQAYDPINLRLAVASHSGKLRMYSWQQKSLNLLWSSALVDVIPSGLIFTGETHNSILVLGLESSEICARDSSTGDIIWRKSLRGGLGSAALSSDGASLLVDNLSSGHFDLYNVPECTLHQSLPVTSKRRFTKQCTFFEGSHLAVCGSDSNCVTIVDLNTNTVISSLMTGKEGDMTQAVAATTACGRTLVAGACGGSIFLWEKSVIDDSPDDVDRHEDAPRFHPSPNSDQPTWLVLALVVLTYPNWSPTIALLLDFARAKIGMWTGL